jgi:hypothetical protein
LLAFANHDFDSKQGVRIMFCKIGDLAVIVNGENRGRFVNVQGRSMFGNEWWFVRVVGKPARGNCVGISNLSHEGNVEDKRLRPVPDGARVIRK